MANRVLFIGWGTPVPGREERSLEVFDEAVGILTRMEQAGRITGFDVVLLDPNLGLDGYMQVAGTPEQIEALRRDEDFMRNTIDAQLCVSGIRHIEGWANEAVNHQMELYQEAIGKVRQFA
jgi:hypothetical protein